MTDQYRFPRFSYDKENRVDPIKDILGFQGDLNDQNSFKKFFPGLIRLRENAVVLRNHTIATSACMPSRASIFTGQYQTRNGVSQTDGLFKSGNANNFPWLEPDGIPTMGSWFQELGYDTHYFGKCHFANPPNHSLKDFGFADWELSYPEPHGASPNNLGFFRDHGFADLACTFLKRKGLGLNWDTEVADAKIDDPGGSEPSGETRPWLAVASFTNPHDIATFPVTVRRLAEGSGTPKYGPLMIPEAGDLSELPKGGSWKFELNPQSFPQENAAPSPSQNDDLSNKPDCHFDYSLKFGIALSSKSGKALITESPDILGLPFQLTSDSQGWAASFTQYYNYCHHVVDQHIDRLLKTLEETNQKENTIVVFVADHGEYAAAHGMMMEKWHTAYQEAIHVPFVVSGPMINQSDDLRQIDSLTSHIDILPTLLGLANVTTEERTQIAEKLRLKHLVPNLVGADLSSLICDGAENAKVIGADGKEREGVLFATDDMITAPLPAIGDPHSKEYERNFKIFESAIETYHDHPKPGWDKYTDRLKPGSVCQPCHVRCVRTERFKLVRYSDLTSEIPVDDQWEMYDLKSDPNERMNLLVYDKPFPTPIEPQPDSDVEVILTPKEITIEAKKLHILLKELEAQMLEPETIKQ